MIKSILLILAIGVASFGYTQSKWEEFTSEGSRVVHWADGEGQAIRLLSTATIGDDFFILVRFVSTSGNSPIFGCTRYTYLGKMGGSIVIQAVSFAGSQNSSLTADGLRASKSSITYAQAATLGCAFADRANSSSISYSHEIYIPLDNPMLFIPKDLWNRLWLKLEIDDFNLINVAVQQFN